MNSSDSKSQLGFSLLELIFALIIVAILFAITYPSYRSFVMNGRRAEAKSALHTTMLRQERYYTQHNSYYAFDSSSQHTSFKWWSGETADTSYYEIDAKACPDQLLNQCVLLTAYPGTEKVRNHSDPICGNLMLDSANNKTYSVSTERNSLCW